MQHKRGKNHKRRLHKPQSAKMYRFDIWSTLTTIRLRLLREKPYTQKEAEAAVGLRTDNGIREKPKATDVKEQLIMDVKEIQSKP